jgi:heme-degrading monooxygenase HmoA
VVWEFHVQPGEEKQFEKDYGPNGAWAELFKQAEGYLGTELNRDLKNPRRYLTLDLWESRETYERFREEHRAEYQGLDVRCEAMTETEKEIGAFERILSRTLTY